MCNDEQSTHYNSHPPMQAIIYRLFYVIHSGRYRQWIITKLILSILVYAPLESEKIPVN